MGIGMKVSQLEAAALGERQPLEVDDYVIVAKSRDRHVGFQAGHCDVVGIEVSIRCRRGRFHIVGRRCAAYDYSVDLQVETCRLLCLVSGF